MLVPVFKKLRPDACAIICVKALADPKEPVLDVVASVYRGFVKTDNEIVAGTKRICKDKCCKSFEKNQRHGDQLELNK